MKPAGYKRLFKKFNTAPLQMTYVASSSQRLEQFGLDCAACAVGIRIIQTFRSVEAAREHFLTMDRSGDFRASLAKAAGMSAEFCQGLDHGWESVYEGSCISKPKEGVDDYSVGFNEGLAAARACKPHKSIGTLIHDKLFG